MLVARPRRALHAPASPPAPSIPCHRQVVPKKKEKTKKKGKASIDEDEEDDAEEAVAEARALGKALGKAAGKKSKGKGAEEEEEPEEDFDFGKKGGKKGKKGKKGRHDDEDELELDDELDFGKKGKGKGKGKAAAAAAEDEDDDFDFGKKGGKKGKKGKAAAEPAAASAPPEPAAAAGPVGPFRVGMVVEVNRHPDAKKLQLASVDVGEEKELTVVCGATNLMPGMITVLAPIGSTVATEKGGSLEIKQAAVRGVVSQGMLCGRGEIGLCGVGVAFPAEVLVLSEDLVPGDTFVREHDLPGGQGGGQGGVQGGGKQAAAPAKAKGKGKVAVAGFEVDEDDFDFGIAKKGKKGKKGKKAAWELEEEEAAKEAAKEEAEAEEEAEEEEEEEDSPPPKQAKQAAPKAAAMAAALGMDDDDEEEEEEEGGGQAAPAAPSEGSRDERSSVSAEASAEETDALALWLRDIGVRATDARPYGGGRFELRRRALVRCCRDAGQMRRDVAADCLVSRVRYALALIGAGHSSSTAVSSALHSSSLGAESLVKLGFKRGHAALLAEAHANGATPSYTTAELVARALRCWIISIGVGEVCSNTNPNPYWIISIGVGEICSNSGCNHRRRHHTAGLTTGSNHRSWQADANAYAIRLRDDGGYTGVSQVQAAKHSAASLAAHGIKRGHAALMLNVLPNKAEDEGAEAERVAEELASLSIPTFRFGAKRRRLAGPSALSFVDDLSLPLFLFGAATPKKEAAAADEDGEDFDFGAKKKKKEKKAKVAAAEEEEEEEDFDFGAKKKKKPKEPKVGGGHFHVGRRALLHGAWDTCQADAEPEPEADFDFGGGEAKEKKKKKKKKKAVEEAAAEFDFSSVPKCVCEVGEVGEVERLLRRSGRHRTAGTFPDRHKEKEKKSGGKSEAKSEAEIAREAEEIAAMMAELEKPEEEVRNVLAPRPRGCRPLWAAHPRPHTHALTPTASWHSGTRPAK